MDSDDFRDMVEECGKILDESLGILADVEFEFESSKEDVVRPGMTKSELVDMAHEVADNARVKKAEASFVRRHFESGPA